MNTVTTAYDAASRLERIADNFASYAYTLDNLGRATNIAQSLATVGGPLSLGFSQQFDLSGNRTQLAATVNGTSDFVNDYTFDGLNRNTRITQAAQGSGPGFNAVAEKRVDLAYNALGQFDLITRYASLDTSALVATSDYAYDSLARLNLLTHQRADSSVINSYDFAYDSLNRITSLNQAIDGLSSFSYDTTNQLTAADHATQADEGYSYDANGNRITVSNGAGSGQQYETGAANRLLSDGTYNYEYDAEGNRTRRTAIAGGASTEYQWDHRNRLIAVTLKTAAGVETARVEYAYDPFDHLIGRAVFENGSATPSESQHFIWDGWNISLILDGSGQIEHRYLTGEAADEIFADEDGVGQVAWYLTDHLNTVRDFIASSGTVLNHRTFDSFGNLTAETNANAVDTLFAFTGGYRDPLTALDLRWHRWYDSHAGRWLSEDPIGFAADEANVYRYAGNTSIIFVDPSGELWQSVRNVGVSAVSGLVTGAATGALTGAFVFGVGAGPGAGAGAFAGFTAGLISGVIGEMCSWASIGQPRSWFDAMKSGLFAGIGAGAGAPALVSGASFDFPIVVDILANGISGALSAAFEPNATFFGVCVGGLTGAIMGGAGNSLTHTKEADGFVNNLDAIWAFGMFYFGATDIISKAVSGLANEFDGLKKELKAAEPPPAVSEPKVQRGPLPGANGEPGASAVPGMPESSGPRAAGNGARIGGPRPADSGASWSPSDKHRDRRTGEIYDSSAVIYNPVTRRLEWPDGVKWGPP